MKVTSGFQTRARQVSWPSTSGLAKSCGRIIHQEKIFFTANGELQPTPSWVAYRKFCFLAAMAGSIVLTQLIIAAGMSKLLWKFDCNPKSAIWRLGGRGDRNNLPSGPTIYDGRVYIAVGQDPDHGEGPGRVWCIDPTKRGDVSEELVLDAEKNRPSRGQRLQASDPSKSEVTQPNPNSAVLWCYTGTDLNRDGKLDFEEEMHRSLSRVVVKNDLAIVTDFSGLVHCIDAKTGLGLWTHDLQVSAWSEPLISAQYVYVADEDGNISVFRLSGDPTLAMPNRQPVAINSLSYSATSSPASANNVLYVASRHRL